MTTCNRKHRFKHFEHMNLSGLLPLLTSLPAYRSFLDDLLAGEPDRAPLGIYGAARPYLVADLHARNFVRCIDGALRVIDLVAAPWPESGAARDSLIADWLARVRENPGASALGGAHDDEL